MTRVLFYGNMGAGKNALAEEISTLTNTEVIAVADPIKAFVRTVFDWSENLLWGPSSGRDVFPIEWERYPEDHWEAAEQRLVSATLAMGKSLTQNDIEKFWHAFDAIKTECVEKTYDPFTEKEGLRVLAPVTARKLCRTFGQVGRAIDPYFWVRKVPAPKTIHANAEFQFVTDIRFPNEIAYLKANTHGGNGKCLVVHIVDPNNPLGDGDITETSMAEFDGWDIWLSNPKDGRLPERAAELLKTLRSLN